MLTRRRFIPTAAALAAAGTVGNRFTAIAQDATPSASPVASPVVASTGDLPLKQSGRLTVHTDQPVYEPWFVDNDPSNGQGFESALTYEIAARLGFAADQVEWGYTPFTSSFAAGPKDFDFYITEVTITASRDEAVDFSVPYYFSPLVVVARDGSPVFEVQSLADLKPYKFGTPTDTTYETYIGETIQPDQDPSVYDSSIDAIQALVDGEIDAVVETLEIAQEIVNSQFPELGIVGLLPDGGEQFGLVFEKGSELVPFVNSALDSIKNDGTLDALIAEWLRAPDDLREIDR